MKNWYDYLSTVDLYWCPSFNANIWFSLLSVKLNLPGFVLSAKYAIKWKKHLKTNYSSDSDEGIYYGMHLVILN